MKAHTYRNDSNIQINIEKGYDTGTGNGMKTFMKLKLIW